MCFVVYKIVNLIAEIFSKNIKDGAETTTKWKGKRKDI